MDNYGFVMDLDGKEETDPIKITAAALNLMEEQRKRLDRAIELFELEREGRIVVLRGADMTNADRISHMSIEEKAKFLTSVVADGCPPAHDWDCMKDEYGWDGCDACWAMWLQQPAKEDA